MARAEAVAKATAVTRWRLSHYINKKLCYKIASHDFEIRLFPAALERISVGIQAILPRVRWMWSRSDRGHVYFVYKSLKYKQKEMNDALPQLEEILASGVNILVTHLDDNLQVSTRFVAEGNMCAQIRSRLDEEITETVRFAAAARTLLKLIQENHDVEVKQLYAYVQTLPEAERIGFPLGIIWPQTMKLDALARQYRDGNVLRTHTRYWKLIIEVKASIACYQNARRASGQWCNI